MANERLRATSWRFEQIKTATNSSAIAQHRKIEEYEKSSNKIIDQEKINNSGFRITWSNKFDILNEKFILRNQFMSQNDELKIIRKANILVRREALKKLLLSEYQIYERELNVKGLTIHRERI